MTIEVTIAGTDQVVEFPDGTPPEVIQQALAKFLTAPSEQENTEARAQLLDKINASLSGPERFAVAAGRGITTIGRGLGLAAPEDPATTQAFQALEEESPIVTAAGEILGESLPFLAAGPLSGAGLAVRTGGRTLLPAAKTLFQKVATGTALGGAEGAVISRGQDGQATAADVAIGGVTGGAIGGTFEIIAPIISRLGRSLMDSVGLRPRGPLLTPDGTPSPEFAQALDETGTSFEDITEQAFAEVNRSGVDPAQAARAARFQSQGIPATRADISQDFAEQAGEQRLLVSATGTGGEQLRQLKLQQSEALTSQINKLVDDLGVPEVAGDTIKDALSGRKTLLTAEKNELYDQVFAASPELKAVPLFTGSIGEALPDQQKLKRLARRPGSGVGAVQDLLVEFGVNKNADDVARFLEGGGNITPLSVGNFEDLRIELNALDRADLSGATGVVVGPVRKALDDEIDLIAEHIEASGLADEGTIEAAKAARRTTRQLKTEFSPQAITGRLIDPKKDGVTPVIEISKVTQELLRPAAAIENLERTLTSLRKAGPKGEKAIGDLQASVILQALEGAVDAAGRKTSGVQTIGGNQFAKALSVFGDDKLAVLFKGRQASLDRLRNLKQTALDISPTGRAIPQGGGAVGAEIFSLMARIMSQPGLAAARDFYRAAANAGADDRAIRRIVKSRPEFRREISRLEADAPKLLTALGLPTLAQLDEGDE